jgi:hypothetical protein
MKWNSAMDTFATSCVLAELFTGLPSLYPCSQIQEHLACFEWLNGPFTSGFANAMKILHPGRFVKQTSPPRIDFTQFPLSIEHNLNLEE